MPIIHGMEHGRDQLRDWINRREFTQREAAKYLSFDETVMSNLLVGKRNPGLANAVKIERLTGIPVEAWMPTELDELGESDPLTAGNLNIGKV